MADALKQESERKPGEPVAWLCTAEGQATAIVRSINRAVAWQNAGYAIRPLVPASDLAALQARVDELEKDAGRYRWLRYRTLSAEMPSALSGVALDRFIDAALSEAKVP